jgi:arylsulfatase A
MSHMHTILAPTPDSPKGSTNIYGDNVSYMDKLVGKLVAELDRLKLREKTLIIFTGDNGTAEGAAHAGNIDNETITGAKGSMLEGGSRVPLIVNWPLTTPAGKTSKDLIDFSDFYVTLAEVAGAKLPEHVTLDGRSFLPQIKGQAGNPREWVYVELDGKRYVRTMRWKLTGDGELFDMKEAPSKEIPVPATATDADAVAARKHLQEVLTGLVGSAASGPATSGPAPANTPAKKGGGKKKEK